MKLSRNNVYEKNENRKPRATNFQPISNNRTTTTCIRCNRSAGCYCYGACCYPGTNRSGTCSLCSCSCSRSCCSGSRSVCRCTDWSCRSARHAPDRALAITSSSTAGGTSCQLSVRSAGQCACVRGTMWTRSYDFHALLSPLIYSACLFHFLSSFSENESCFSMQSKGTGGGESSNV